MVGSQDWCPDVASNTRCTGTPPAKTLVEPVTAISPHAVIPPIVTARDPFTKTLPCAVDT